MVISDPCCSERLHWKAKTKFPNIAFWGGGGYSVYPFV